MKKKDRVERMKFYSVASTVIKDTEKRVFLQDRNGKPFTVKLHRHALLGKGDQLCIDPNHPRNVYTVSKESSEDLVRVSPHFQSDAELKLGGLRFSLRFTEVAAKEDLSALLYLEQFHYKTFDAEQQEEDSRKSANGTGGRRAVLIGFLKSGQGVTPVGYVVLQMPLLMVKPRHLLFDKGFKHPGRPIQWNEWDMTAVRRYVNTLVRIARIVVHPEYRGLGLSKWFIEMAKQFAKERWQVGGLRPLFLEISAEMLNYIDFVSKSGFVLIGKTEGNLARVVKDLGHMAKGYEVTSGIMSLQKRYLSSLLEYCRDTGQDFERVLDRLSTVTQSDDPLNALSPTEWLNFRKVLRFPIPYYLCALDEGAQAFLTKNIEVGRRSGTRRFAAPNVTIDAGRVKVSSRYRIPQTKNVRLILNCFAINATHLNNILAGPVNIRASSGNLIFIAGSSGTGKSVLLRALDPETQSSDPNLQISMVGKLNYTVSWLRTLPEDVPIFDVFADRYSAAQALSALSQVGLSEAFAFIKPFKLLSRGQRYRAMLADLLLRNDPVWLIDEFCADLDPIAARIVAHNLRKNVIHTGRVAFVAAANHAHFLDALRPTQVIHLRLGGEASFLNFKEYRDGFLANAC